MITITLCIGAVGGWVLTFIHELGHALAAVLLTPQRVMLHVGDGPDPLRLSVGRIDMRLSVRSGGERAGHVEFVPPGLSPAKLFWMAVAGPLASAAAAVALTVAAVRLVHPDDLLFWSMLVCAITAALGVVNLVPRTFVHQRLPGVPLVIGMSDGLIALHALRGTTPWASPPPPRTILPEAAAMGSAAREVLNTAFAIPEPGAPVTAESLLAALADTPGPAHDLLTEHRVPFRATRHHPVSVPRPATAALDHVCRRAPRLRSLDGSPYVTPLHLLLALLDDPSGEAAELLAAAGVSGEALRADTVAALAASVPAPM